MTAEEISEGLEAIAGVRTGGHFFGAPHTLARYETAFYQPLVSDWQSYEAWELGGREDRRRARDRQSGRRPSTGTSSRRSTRTSASASTPTSRSAGSHSATPTSDESRVSSSICELREGGGRCLDRLLQAARRVRGLLLLVAPAAVGLARAAGSRRRRSSSSGRGPACRRSAVAARSGTPSRARSGTATSSASPSRHAQSGIRAWGRRRARARGTPAAAPSRAPDGDRASRRRGSRRRRAPPCARSSTWVSTRLEAARSRRAAPASHGRYSHVPRLAPEPTIPV